MSARMNGELGWENDLRIETVSNGFIVFKPEAVMRTTMGFEFNKQNTFIFDTPAKLTVWMEKWAVERKKEMTK